MALEMVTTDGGLYKRGSGYVSWRVGDSAITLDGDFTIAELQQFIDHMVQAQPDDTDQAIDEAE